MAENRLSQPDSMDAAVLVLTQSIGSCPRRVTVSNRMTGFTRYLPEYGWRVLLIKKHCRCVEARPAKGELVLTGEEIRGGRADAKIAVAYREVPDSLPFIISIKAGVSPVKRIWLWFAGRTGLSLNIKENGKEENWHFGPFCAESEYLRVSRNGIMRGLFWTFRKTMGFLSRRFLFEETDWADLCLLTSKSLARLEPRLKIVLSSSPPAEIHTAGHRVARTLNLPWVADFRDSVVKVEPGYDSPAGKIRLGCLTDAQKLIYMTQDEADKDSMLRRAEICVIPNGFLEEEMARARQIAGQRDRDERFVLRYLGSSIHTNPLDPFYEGFAEWLKSARPEEGRVLFEYYGRYHEQVREEAEAYGISDFVRVFPQTDLEEALVKTITAAVLILPLNPVHPGSPGAKFYEYLASGVPVLAVGSGESYVAGVLEETGAGKIAPTTEETARVLEDWFGQFEEKGSISLNRSPQAVEKYSRRKGMRKMAGVLRRSCRFLTGESKN